MEGLLQPSETTNVDPAVLRLRSLLIEEFASSGRLGTHERVATLLGPAVADSFNRRLVNLHHWLEALAAHEANAGRPMLTAVVVSDRTGLPTEGFFSCADALGYETGSTRADRLRFWASQVSKTLDHWYASRPDGS
jgi:hypothetical protein